MGNSPEEVAAQLLQRYEDTQRCKMHFILKPHKLHPPEFQLRVIEIVWRQLSPSQKSNVGLFFISNEYNQQTPQYWQIEFALRQLGFPLEKIKLVDSSPEAIGELKQGVVPKSWKI